MATGLLGRASISSNRNSGSPVNQTVYTVPSGKYAVVHITLAASPGTYDGENWATLPIAKVDGTVCLMLPMESSFTGNYSNGNPWSQGFISSNSVSMMLSAGNKIEATSGLGKRVGAGNDAYYRSVTGYCTVSGYEVDV